ncbi:MAG: hypothetical protein QM756_32795 [Polyangiaceae bacterium]
MRFGLSTARAVSVGVLALLCALPAAAGAPAGLKVLSGAGATSAGVFSAGPEGAELGFPSGATLRMSPEASVRVFGQPQRLDLDHSGKTPTWSFALLKGRVDVEVPDKPKSALLVSNERGSVVVMSGRATLIASAGELCAVNGGGSVSTFVNNRFGEIAVGRAVRLDAEHPRGQDEPLPQAPTFAGGQRMWFAAQGSAAVGNFAWNAVAGASTYQVELRSGGQVLAHSTLSETRLSGVLSELAPGEYELGVRGVDRRGIAGAWSEPRSLRVIGVELPTGAYAEAGGVFLAGGQRVTFSHAAGLEMTYLGAGGYVPATGSVGLQRNARTVVSFRWPGNDEQAIARLEPRDVFADVFVGPKTAVWPRDAVEIKVRVRTRAGAPAPAFLQVVPRVQLGVEVLKSTGSALETNGVRAFQRAPVRARG